MSSLSFDMFSIYSALSMPSTQEFRLTLTPNKPAPDTDVLSATQIHCTPYKGNKISLYNGTSWSTHTSPQFSLELGTLVDNMPYDVFCYDNANEPALESLVWATETTRVTDLNYQDGVLVKADDVTRRYLGSFYTTSATETEDSIKNRYLWNYYHRIHRPMFCTDTAISWTYNGTVWRQANDNVTNQINMMIGLNEDAINATAQFYNVSSSGVIPQIAGIAIGLDSTTTPVTMGTYAKDTISMTASTSLTAAFNGFVGIGKHSLVWLEISDASDTRIFSSDSASGIIGSVLA